MSNLSKTLEVEQASDNKETQGKSKFLRFYEKFMILTGIAGNSLFLFQAAKIYTMQSAHAISLTGFLVSLFSLLSWMFYGFFIKDKVVFWVNVFGSAAASICVLSIFLV